VTVDLRAASGLDVTLDEEALALAFGSDVVHPARVRRRLADVRATLADPKAVGPEHLYTIYMDICRAGDHAALIERSLLYGAVVYNHGQIGRERLRSQGHRHSRKPGTELRYSEVYEFWSGHGFVYLQKECDAVVTRALELRAPGGPGHFVLADGEVVANPRCAAVTDVEVVAPNDLPLLAVPNDLPIYQAWQQSPGLFDFLPKPELVEQAWANL
jgi:hypothetical protein